MTNVELTDQNTIDNVNTNFKLSEAVQRNNVSLLNDEIKTDLPS